MNPLTVLSYIAHLATLSVGLISIAAGLRSLLKPADFATSFGLPPSPSRSPAWLPVSHQHDRKPSLEKQTQTQSESKHVVPDSPSSSEPHHYRPETEIDNPFIPVVGVRNIALGLSILAFNLLNDTRTTGVLLLCNLVSMAGDTVICHRQGSKGSAVSHLVASLVFAGLGGYMVLREQC
ncbi:hypothetical protein LTR67_002002 [Exophiala xenobiotica]